MTISVMSDIHDNIWNLERALPIVAGSDALLFLGDFCAPFTLEQMAEGFSNPIHVVFGNNDGDTFLISQVASVFSHVILHGQFAELDMDGCRIAIQHYPEVARPLAASGIYDAVFYGHDHKRHLSTVDSSLLANPGEVMGRFGKPSIGRFDTESRRFSHIDIKM